MAKNILVISCDIRETRAALIENGIIAELHIERKGRQSSTVGNVYLGKVTRVLPGLQAAFIDIGQERAAFLHVEDLIRPDDFDEYLAGGRKLARGEGTPAAEEEVDEGEEEAAPAAPPEEPGAVSAQPTSVAPPTPLAVTARGDDLEATVAYPDWPHPPAGKPAPVNGTAARAPVEHDAASRSSEPPSLPTGLATEPSDSSLPLLGDASSPALAAFDRPSSEELEAQAPESVPSINSAPTLDELPLDDEGDRPSPVPGSHEDEIDHLQPDDVAALEPAEAEAVVAEDEEEDEDEDEDDLDIGDLPGFTISEPGEPVPRAPAPRTAERGGERGERAERGGRRRRGRGRGRTRADERAPAEARGRGERGGDRGRGDRRGGRSGGQALPGRISKSTPIREVVKEGQEIIVQVTKDPIGTKGARCSSHISLPGRYVVYLPTVDHIGISKRIGSDKERARLREAIEAMKPPSGGLIVRTVAEGLTKKGLKQDVGYLVRLWGEIAKKREGAKSPYLLSSELDLVLKVARDLFTDEVDEVVIDDKQQYERLCRFVEMFAPERVKSVKFYDEEEPIFDEYGIEDEIARALSRKVPLPSGGYLIIDQAEALTAIDVNTGRFVGKGSKDMEETILKTNLEAVHEIAYQLRFRNIGGLIILDLIDMEKHSNREKVRRTLEELLQKDKAKTTLNRISELGLIEMTRKRTRESLGRLLHEPCFYCDGTGQLQSKETIAYEILREIRRKRSTLPGYTVVVNAHPAVADVLNGTERAALQDAESRFMRKIVVTPRKEYHLEQFDLQGK